MKKNIYTLSSYLLFIGIISVCLAGPVLARLLPVAGDAPVQTFYLPVPDDQVYESLLDIYPGVSEVGGTCEGGAGIPISLEPIRHYSSISVGSNETIIYYDHHEDGYELSIANGVQTTTEIWGDGDLSNGAAPGYADDLLDAGNVIILNSDIMLAEIGTTIYFDGGDKIGSTGPLAVTRVGWTDGPNTLLAGAFEVLPLPFWGTEFVIPVGSDLGEDTPTLPGTDSHFEYTTISVMAQANGTTVDIDTDGDGTVDQSVTLDEGDTYFDDTGMIEMGATVTSSAPVQVHMITGNICSTYESRWYTLYAREDWSDSYYTPVGSTDGASDPANTTIVLYNPGTAPITVDWDVITGTQTAVTVPAGGIATAVVPDGTGAHFYTSDASPFYAIAVVDYDGTRTTSHDWGYTLSPDSVLTPQVLIGFADGDDPTSPEVQNAAPVWITVVGADGVDVCIDYNGDGGPLTDPNGIGYDELITLDELATYKAYDPDGDQTGAYVYICDESGANLAVAWGQDPSTANAGAPAIDMGTGIPPLPSYAAGKSVVLFNDVNEDGKVSIGDTLEYSIAIANSSRVPIASDTISIVDTLIADIEYVPNSTIMIEEDINGNVTIAIPDAGTSQFPLDEVGYLLDSVLGVNGKRTIQFQTIVRSAPQSEELCNVATIGRRDVEFSSEACIPVDPTITAVTLNAVEAESGQVAVYALWLTVLLISTLVVIESERKTNLN